MAIDWDSIEKQAAEKSAALRSLDGRTTGGRAPVSAQAVSLPMARSSGTSALDGFGAVLAKSTLSASPLENAAARSAIMPEESERASLTRQLNDVTSRQRETQRQLTMARRSGGVIQAPDGADERKAQLRQEAADTRRDISRLDYLDRYGNIVKKDDFSGQFGASFDMGTLGQDEAEAWNRYLDDPSDANRRYAEAVSKAREDYAARNAEALDENATLTLFSQSLAGYLPQFIRQQKAGLGGAAAGAAVGSFVPVAGTVAGAKAGYVAGNAKYGYDTARGAAYKALIDAGVDDATARAAAGDEAVVNSILEGGDAVLDLITLGGGKAISAVLGEGAKKAASSTAGKNLLKALAGYGINIFGEGAQEWAQEGVSIANHDRVRQGRSGALDLAGASLAQAWKALSGGDPEGLAQMNAAGVEGMKIAALMGGGSMLANRGIQQVGNKIYQLPVRQQTQNVETLPTAAQNSVSGNGSASTTPTQNGAQEAVTDAPAQQTGTVGKTTENARLTDSDLKDYLSVGTREHVRNTKAAQLRAGQSPILTSLGQIQDFIKSAISGKTRDTIKAYGKVGSKMASDISQKAGFPVGDIDGYYLELDSNRMNHLSDHIKDDGDIRNIPLTEEQVLNLPEYIDAYDDVLDVVKKKDGSVKVYLGKRINGHAVIVELLSKGRQSIQPVTAWQNTTEHYMKKYGKNKTQVDTSQPSVYAEGESGYKPASSDPTIPQQAQGVKTEDMQRAGGVSPESSVGAAAYGFDPYSNLQNQTGDFHPDGERAYRQVDVPKRDANGRNIPKSTATVMEAQATPDSAVGVIQSAIADGKFSFDTNTDKGAVARGEAMILEKGFDGAREVFHQAAQKGYLSKDMVALGQLLLNSAMNSHDNAATVSLMHDYASMSTTAAQSMQAQRILKKLSPEWQLYSVQRSVENFQNALRERLGKKAPDIQVPDELYQNYVAAADQESRDAAMTEIYKNVASQVPASWMDKWNAWRYLSMLGNPRTHIRNIAGNVGFQPLRVTKDAVAAAIEAAASAVTGGKVERTKAFSADPALYRAAWDDWGSVSDTLSQGGKYNDAVGEIESRRKIFTLPVLEKARTGNSFLLEAEDAVFKRITYADALAKFLKANGVTAEQLQSGQVDGKLLDRAREYAGQEALKATFQDRNAVSDFVASLGGSQNVPAPVRTIAEGVLPFRRTPANILVRGAEYSPLGLAKSLTADLYKVKNGEMSAAQAIDNIAAGATGTALFGLGALLLSMGLVTPGKDDDEKQAALDDLAGKQAYALQLPDGTSYTLDWMAPEALPFFMGVELADNWLKEGFTVDGLAAALASVSEPMLEMSMLQSVNDLLDSIKYAKSSGNIAGIVQSALTSYLTQAIPTLGGQIERTAEDRRMTTYTDKGLPLPTDVQYAIGKASARLPGLDYQQIPYIDAWGREQEAEPLPIRAAENFLSPGYISALNQTEADKEVQRLYTATGDGKVVPTRAAKYVTVNEERKDLSKEEYVTYATTKGQTAHQIVEALISNRDYLSLSDTDKADAIANAYEYANAVGKASVSGYQPDGWVKKAIDGQIDPALYILYKASADADGNKSVTQAEAEAAIKRLPVSQKQKAYLWQSQNAGWKAEKNPFQ